MDIKEIIVVEGKTDTLVLKELFNCDTIETNGSALTKETIALIKKANEVRGIILFLDPDYPGMRIRNEILKEVPDCKQAFINKKDAIAKNKVGVAEGKKEAIKQALLNCVTFDSSSESLSWNEFVSLDIIGNKARRDYLFNYFNLGYGNNKVLFKRFNMLNISKEIIEKALKKEEDKE